MNAIRYISFFVLILLLSSCTATDSNSKEEPSFWEPLIISGQPLPQASAPMEVSLTLSDNQVSADESLTMVLNAKNTSKDSITVTMSAGSGPNYDFVVINSDSSIVWGKLNDYVTLAAVIYDFAPGETKTFEHSWNLTDEQGDQVKKGEYAVFGGFPHFRFTKPGTSEERRGPVATEMQQIIIE